VTIGGWDMGQPGDLARWEGAILIFDSWALGEAEIMPEDAFQVACEILPGMYLDSEITTEDGRALAHMRVRCSNDLRALPSERDRDKVASALCTVSSLREALNYQADLDAMIPLR
jgi:hypothetical protein